MKSISKYSELLNSIRESNRINEKSLNPDKIESVMRLKSAGDMSSILKEIGETVDKIISNLKSMDFDKIEYDKDDHQIIIRYDKASDYEIHNLQSYLRGGNDPSFNRRIKDRIFGDDESDPYLEFTIDFENFNRIDINNSLPNFMKGLGIGKKSYKKLIKDFGYISSFNGYDPSIESSMVWRKISSDCDIYTFINDNNIISFWNELDYKFIFNILNKFYNGNLQGSKIDDDFITKFNLKEEDFKNSLTKQI